MWILIQRVHATKLQCIIKACVQFELVTMRLEHYHEPILGKGLPLYMVHD